MVQQVVDTVGMAVAEEFEKYRSSLSEPEAQEGCFPYSVPTAFGACARFDSGGEGELGLDEWATVDAWLQRQSLRGPVLAGWFRGDDWVSRKHGIALEAVTLQQGTDADWGAAIVPVDRLVALSSGPSGSNDDFRHPPLLVSCSEQRWAMVRGTLGTGFWISAEAGPLSDLVGAMGQRTQCYLRS